MKKILATVFTVFLTMGFVSCSLDDELLETGHSIQLETGDGGEEILPPPPPPPIP